MTHPPPPPFLTFLNSGTSGTREWSHVHKAPVLGTEGMMYPSGLCAHLPASSGRLTSELAAANNRLGYSVPLGSVQEAPLKLVFGTMFVGLRTRSQGFWG